MRDLPEDNLYYPVLIRTSQGSGSGFYFRRNSTIFLATALHVLFTKDTDGLNKLISDEAVFQSYDKNTADHAPVTFRIDLTRTPIRKDDSKDIVLIEMGSTDLNSEKDGVRNTTFGNWVAQTGNPGHIVTVPHTSTKKFEDVLVSNEVYILGYPSSLGLPGASQIQPERPLLRKGIIAGKNTLNETIILDCPVYFGNSGGLAIEVEWMDNLEGKNFRVIGVVSEFVPFVEKLKSQQLGYTNLNFENSGYSIVVPMNTILQLTEENPE